MKYSGLTAATEPRRWTPHPYQVKAVRWLLSRGGAGLFLDPGLGKTSINLAAIKVLKAEGELRHDPAVVVCQLRPLYNVWDPSNPESEPAVWTDFHGLRFQLLHGDRKEEALREKCDVRLINPEGLEWYFSRVRPPRDGRRFPLLDIDESTIFKHTSTERFRLLRGWLPFYRRRWINTGTPSPNGLLDLFGQVYILDMGNALGQYITHYRRKFFLPTGYGGYEWTIKGANDRERSKTEEQIYEAVSPLVLRMDEKDYLKLPKLHGALAHSEGPPNFTRVRMPPRAAAKFAELEEEFFVEMEEGEVSAVNAAVKHMKLRQAANGGIYLDRERDGDGRPLAGPRKWAHLHDAKTEGVVELVEGLEGKGVVVAIEFHHDAERLRRHKLLRNAPLIGERSLKEDAAIVRDWNAGRLALMMLNPASMSRGSNLQRGGDALIFHSMIWNFEHYDQLIRRFWRQGRRRPFYVHHVICEGTHDLLIARALGGKNAAQRSLLNALRAHSRARLRRQP